MRSFLSGRDKGEAETLCQCFPDVSPVFVEECLAAHSRMRPEDRFNTVTDKLIELNGHYPRASEWSAECLNRTLLLLAEAFPRAAIDHIRKVMGQQTCDIGDRSAKILAEAPYPARKYNSKPTATQRFHSKTYQRQCKALLYNAYPTLWKAQIRAVLSECNFHYPAAKVELDRILSLKQATSGGVGWLVETGLSLLVGDRRPLPLPNERELERDLREGIAEHRQMIRVEQEGGDHDLARRLNEELYQETGDAIGCQCCYGDYAFEDIGACNAGHTFCRTCIATYVKENIMGQYVSEEARPRPITCFADGAECDEAFSEETLQRCLPDDVRRWYMVAVVKSAVTEAGLRVYTCGACGAADIYRRLPVWMEYARRVQRALRLPPGGPLSQLTHIDWAIISPLTIWLLPSLIRPRSFLTMSASFTILLLGLGAIALRLLNLPSNVFVCRNPECGMHTCLGCHREDHAPLLCNDPENLLLDGTADGLRLYIEQKMARALVRTCPRCSCQFYKHEGCNKMTCPSCGWVMCYICRQDIRTEGYAHFCNHLHLIPNICSQGCKKCGLWYCEDDERRCVAAGKHAIEEFITVHPHMANQARALTHVGPYMLR